MTLWVHGHVHDAYHYTIHGPRVVCNPRAYAPEPLTPDLPAGLGCDYLNQTTPCRMVELTDAGRGEDGIRQENAAWRLCRAAHMR
jgi:hypothetical protein